MGLHRMRLQLHNYVADFEPWREDFAPALKAAA